MANSEITVLTGLTPRIGSGEECQEGPQAPLADRPEPTPGAPPSNTAPANSIFAPNGTLILRSGVDSLYVSYPGSLPRVQAEWLETLKQRAQSNVPGEVANALLALNNHLFEVRDRGKGRFPFVLVDNWFHLQISGYQASRLPLAYAQVRSELLTLAGWQPALTDLTDTIGELKGGEELPGISRVDLCVDFVTSVDIASITQDAWVTRAKNMSLYRTAGRFTGCAFGLGGDIACRLYDKSEELRKSRKEYLKPLWETAGWDGASPVWRLEFQFKRTVLRELGIECAEDLAIKTASLWRYAMQEWLRLTVPSAGDSTRARWPEHPLWSDLVNVRWDRDTGEVLARVSKSRVPNDHSLFVIGISGITSYMARERIADFQEGLYGFVRDALDHHRARGKTTGVELEGYALAKAREKARRFNTLINPGPKPDNSTEVEE